MHVLLLFAHRSQRCFVTVAEEGGLHAVESEGGESLAADVSAWKMESIYAAPQPQQNSPDK